MVLGLGVITSSTVAVGDDARELSLAVDDADATKTLGGNLHHGIAHARAKLRQRDGIALVHDVAHESQLCAELSARVQDTEVDGGEAAAFQERDCQRVAKRKLHQRGCGGREVMRAGFARLRQREYDIGGMAER
jgi:hypothetical protein